MRQINKIYYRKRISIQIFFSVPSGIIRKGTKEKPGTGLKIRPSLSVGATSIHPAVQVMDKMPPSFLIDTSLEVTFTASVGDAITRNIKYVSS